MAEQKVVIPQLGTRKKRPRYTPVSRRHDRPNAVLWLLRQHPELKDSQIIRLVGTTKPTITQIRDRTHWNSPNLVPQDPVTLGLCKQLDLDAEVKKAAKRVAAQHPGGLPPPPAEGGLLPATETVPGLGPQPDFEMPDRGQSEAAEDAEVFARLQQLSSGEESAADKESESVDPESVFSEPAAEAEAETETASDATAEPEDKKEEQEEAADEYGLKAYVDPFDADAVKAIVKFCGIALRSTDASLVSCSSKDELARVRDSFLKKKLALDKDDETLDAAIAEVCERMKDTRRKHRVIFYYLLAEKFEMLESLKG